MTWIIIYLISKKRVPNTPKFDYPKQAQNYIEKFMGNSPYITFRKE